MRVKEQEVPIQRILSIDGGGIRGTFPAAYLAQLEAGLDEPIYKYFDLIVGTSTGGIIAIGLAMGIPAKDILNLYVSRGPEIFSQQKGGLWGCLGRLYRGARWLFWAPKYTSEALQNVLNDVLGKFKIGDAKTRLMIPAWDPQNMCCYIFKTAHHERFRTDYKDPACDAAMATASAPTYFPKFTTTRDVTLIDGGIWANNPTGIAVAEGVGTLGWKPSEIRVLSVGCLEEAVEMSAFRSAIWFLLSKSAKSFMGGQSYGANALARTLTGHVGGSQHKAIHRISFKVSKGSFPLDDTSKIKDLKKLALEQADINQPDLLEVFFSAPAQPFQPIYKVPK